VGFFVGTGWRRMRHATILSREGRLEVVWVGDEVAAIPTARESKTGIYVFVCRSEKTLKGE